MDEERKVIRGIKTERGKKTAKNSTEEHYVKDLQITAASRNLPGIKGLLATKCHKDSLPAEVRCKKHKKRSRTAGERILIVLFVLQLAALAALGSLGVEDQMPYVQAKRKNISIKEQSIEEPSINEVPVPDEGQEAWNGDPFKRQVNWEYLKSVNPDIKAWIWIPGTPIDYPVLLGSDNSQYLNSASDGRPSELGSLFLPAGADGGFSDVHNVIFGHNTAGHQMFGRLSDYGSHSFASNYLGAWIYTPEKIMRYEAFGAFPVPVDDPVYGTADTATRAGLDAYLQMVNHMYDSSLWHTERDVTAGLDNWKTYLEKAEKDAEKKAVTTAMADPLEADEKQSHTKDIKEKIPEKPGTLTLSTCTNDGALGRRFVVNFILTETR